MAASAPPDEVQQHSTSAISSKINLSVKNVEDGCQVFFKISPTSELGKLMDSYCLRKSKKYNTVVFYYNGRVLRGEQTPDELRMEDGDEICAYDVEYLMRMFESSSSQSQGVQGGVNGQFGPVLKQERRDDDIRYLESLDGYTFDELMQEATHNFMQAISNVKATALKANKLTAGARKLLGDDDIEPLPSGNFYGNIAPEQMLDDGNPVGGQIHEKLRRANAEILVLSRKQSQLDEELMNVKKKLIRCNDYRARLCEEIEGIGGATMEESHNEANKTQLHAPISINQSPVHDNAAPSNVMQKEENEHSTDDAQHNVRICATMEESHNEPNKTQLNVPISANQSPVHDEAAPINMMDIEETEQLKYQAQHINVRICATMEESHNDANKTQLHAPISVNQSPVHDHAALSNMTQKEENEHSTDDVQHKVRICATMEESHNEPNKIQLHVPISANQSPVHDDAAPSNMMDIEETEQLKYLAQHINVRICATMEESHNEPNRTQLHAPISANQSLVQDTAMEEESHIEPNKTQLHVPISASQSPLQDAAAPNNVTDKEDEQPTDHAEHIYVRIIGPTGTPVALKTLKSTPLRNVMQAYCGQERKDLDSMRFLSNGCLLEEEQTPDELQMEDGTEIKAELKESGGV